MKLVLNAQEIMSSVRRDLKERGYVVGELTIQWKNDAYIHGIKVEDGYVKIEAEVTRL